MPPVAFKDTKVQPEKVDFMPDHSVVIKYKLARDEGEGKVLLEPLGTHEVQKIEHSMKTTVHALSKDEEKCEHVPRVAPHKEEEEEELRIAKLRHPHKRVKEIEI